MKITTYYSHVTHMDYQFDECDVQQALLSYYKITVGKDCKVEISLFEGIEGVRQAGVELTVRLEKPQEESPNENHGASSV